MASKVIEYERLPYQAEFHDSLDPNVYLSAGYGAGKTYSLCMKTFKLMSINKGIPGGFLAPDLKMFKRDVVPTFKQICRAHRIPFRFNKQESTLIFPTTRSIIYVFHSEDDGDSIRGPNLGFGLVNEITMCSEGAFDAFLSRIRIKEANLRQIAMSGTPEGFNWTYDKFIANPRRDTKLIFGDMRMNKHIAEDYAKRLAESYDDVLQAQFIEGRFLNTNGKAAVYKFNRMNHAHDEVTKRDGLPVWVSIDFNVAPMSATLWNRYPDGTDGPLLRAFDEICIDNSDTFELAQEIKNRVDPHDEVVLFPDPAGNARSTKSQKTDIQILRDAGFQDIRFRSRIKSVKDCLTALNSFVGKNKLMVNSKKCRNVILDLEQCVLKPGTNELDKSNPKRTHWLDGLKNMIEFEFPITVGAGGWRETQIR
jgi:hypothetical protein